METVTTLDDKVRAFKVLLDKKDELAEQTKANNEELKNLEQEIAQQMVDEEKPDTTAIWRPRTMKNCRKKWQRYSPFIRNLRYPREQPTPRL